MNPFSKTSQQISLIPSKLAKVEILSQYLKELSDEDLKLACVYFTGSAFSARDVRTLNLGGQMIKKALSKAVGMTNDEDIKIIDEIALRFSEPGDMAEYILQVYRDTKSNNILLENYTLKDAEDFFNSIYITPGSIAKVNLLSELYIQLPAYISKYVTKILAGDLRIGLKEASVEEAIAKAFERKSSEVKNANMLIGDIGEVAIRSKDNILDNITLTPFWPVKSMLATPAEDGQEIINRMGENLWVEDKYDGIRCQAHKFNNEIKLFSRDQNEMTSQFPEIVRYIQKIPHDVILDGEIMAFKDNEIMRFFFLQHRLGRKTISEEMLKEIPLEYFIYDILYLDGKELLNTSIKSRREIIESILGNKETKYNNTSYDGIHFSHKEEIIGLDQLEQAFDNAKARVTEGLIIKKSDSTYKPGRRGIDWLKYKKALEPLDVVITGVEYGHGKKRGFLSDYTFAVRELKTGELVNIGKAYSGVTDEEIKMLTERFLNSTIEVFGRFRTVIPEVVLEIMFESIQRSARHKSGYALRFPRITKIRIGDKGVDDISTLQDVDQMYHKHFEGQ